MLINSYIHFLKYLLCCTHALLFSFLFSFFHAFLFRDFYHSEIMKMNYGSRRLRLGVPDSSVGPVIFDSGSSYTYFLQQAYSDLVASVSVFIHSHLKNSRNSSWHSKSTHFSDYLLPVDVAWRSFWVRTHPRYVRFNIADLLESRIPNQVWQKLWLIVLHLVSVSSIIIFISVIYFLAFS